MGTEAPRELVVYTRNYCHLCDEMIAGLREMQARFVFALRIVDVDADPALEARYGAKVPVLTGHGAELCHYHLDPGRVAAYLERPRPAASGDAPG